MAGQGQDSFHSAASQMGGQPQMIRDEMTDQQQQSTNAQNTNFLNQTGDQVKTMAHGAADIASGAAKGAMGIAQGMAVGAANLTQGAASAVKNTFGVSPDNTSNNTSLPTTTNHPAANNPSTRI